MNTYNNVNISSMFHILFIFNFNYFAQTGFRMLIEQLVLYLTQQILSKKCIAKFQVFAVFAEVRHTTYLMQAAKHSILEHTQYNKD